MRFVHISLTNTTLVQPELDALEAQFWTSHAFPAKPVPAAGVNAAAFALLQQTYQTAKEQLQDEWLQTLENWTAGQIAKALMAVKYDPQDTSCFYVITLPECYWHDVEPAGRTHADAAGNPVFQYKNPLYEVNVVNLLTGRGGNDGVMASISQANLAIFAGTIWWKDAAGALYNTAPVFHSKACCFLWEKQIVTKEDGLGQSSANPADKLHKWVNARRTAFAAAGVPNAAAAVTMDEINDCADAYIAASGRGFLSPLAQNFNPTGLPQSVNPAAQPFLILPLPAACGLIHRRNSITFCIDICADFIYGLSNRLLLGRPVPDIQIVPAAGASYMNDKSYCAQYYHCICDYSGFSGTVGVMNQAHYNASFCASPWPDNLSVPLTNTLFNATPPLPLF